MRTPANIGQDLRDAREAWGLSREELAARAELEEDDVRAAELGQATPGVLDDLARSLGGNLDELMLGHRFWEAPAVVFRSAPGTLDRAEVRRVLARVASAARLRRWLVDLLGQPDEWTRTRERLSPVGLAENIPEQAEELAGRVRAHVGNPLEPIVSVRALMRRLGVATFLADFSTEEVDGMMWRDAAWQKATACAAANVRARGGLVTALRATFAHELCHALFDGTHEQASGRLEDRDTPRADALERRANAFMIYLLAPREAVAGFLRDRGVSGERKPNHQDLLAMARYFGLGVEACANHLCNLRILNREESSRFRDLRSPREALGFRIDDAERALPAPRNSVELELRGEILDLATRALLEGFLTEGRFREILGLHYLDDWRRLLPGDSGEELAEPGPLSGEAEEPA
jgi:transcriptional regulator with XRE-family HTH domain